MGVAKYRLLQTQVTYSKAMECMVLLNNATRRISITLIHIIEIRCGPTP